MSLNDQKEVTALILSSNEPEINQWVSNLVNKIPVTGNTIESDLMEITSLESLNNNEIIAGSFSGNIQILNIKNGKKNDFFRGGKYKIESLASHGNIFCSYSGFDITIWYKHNQMRISINKFLGIDKIFNTNTIYFPVKINHDERHSYNRARKLIKLTNNTIAFGAEDHGIKIWDVQKNRCLQILKGHSEAITSLYQLSDNTIASGAYDATVKIWDIVDGTCLLTLEGHKYYIDGIAKLSHNTIVCASKNELKVWDIEKGICLHTFSTQDVYFNWIYQLSENILISNSHCKNNSVIRLWNISNNSRFETNWKMDVIKQIDRDKIISAAKTKTRSVIKVGDAEILIKSLKLLQEGLSFDDLIDVLNSETTLEKLTVKKLYPFIIDKFFDLNFFYK